MPLSVIAFVEELTAREMHFRLDSYIATYIHFIQTHTHTHTHTHADTHTHNSALLVVTHLDINVLRCTFSREPASFARRFAATTAVYYRIIVLLKPEILTMKTDQTSLMG